MFIFLNLLPFFFPLTHNWSLTFVNTTLKLLLENSKKHKSTNFTIQLKYFFPSVFDCISVLYLFPILYIAFFNPTSGQIQTKMSNLKHLLPIENEFFPNRNTNNSQGISEIYPMISSACLEKLILDTNLLLDLKFSWRPITNKIQILMMIFHMYILFYSLSLILVFYSVSKRSLSRYRYPPWESGATHQNCSSSDGWWFQTRRSSLARSILIPSSSSSIDWWKIIWWILRIQSSPAQWSWTLWDYWYRTTIFLPFLLSRTW